MFLSVDMQEWDELILLLLLNTGLLTMHSSLHTSYTTKYEMKLSPNQVDVNIFDSMVRW